MDSRKKENNIEDYDFRKRKQKDKSIRLLGVWGTFSLLVLVAAAVGTVVIVLFQNFQNNQFDAVYSNSLSHFSTSIEFSFENLQYGFNTLNQVYNGAIINNLLNGSNPNITLTNYENIVMKLTPIIISSSLSFSPLVTTLTKKGFEAYVKNNVDKLKGPSSLHNQVSNGILNATSGLPVGNYIYGSQYPMWHFPVWQTSPINTTSNIVMMDLHTSSNSGVIQTIDNAISSGSTYISNINQVSANQQFNGYKTPYSTTIAPMLNSQGALYGIASGIVNWVSFITYTYL